MEHERCDIKSRPVLVYTTVIQDTCPLEVALSNIREFVGAESGCGHLSGFLP